MFIGLTDEDRLVADFAGKFLRERGGRPYSAVMDDSDLWAAFAQMGWLAVPFQEDADLSTLAVLMEALGREGVHSPYLPSIWAATLLARAPGETSADIQARVTSGALTAAVADSEGVTAERVGARFLLNGRAELVLGDRKAVLLAPARFADGTKALFLVRPELTGVELRPITTVDGSAMADVSFQNVRLEQADRLGVPELDAVLAWARDRCAALLCAEALGAMAALLDRTADHVRNRVQFGRPLRSFQVIEHTLADMAVELEEARAVTLLALAKIDAPPMQRTRATSAAKVKVAANARALSQAAVQLHGAMGVTEELDVGAYFKRLLVLGTLLGTRSEHLDRYTALARADGVLTYLATGDGRLEATPNLTLNACDLDFRERAASFLDAALAPDLVRAQTLTTTVYAEADVAQRWQKIVQSQNLAAPNWPAAFGGPGWTPIQRYIWAQETGRRFTPIYSPIGLSLVGPVLMHFGSEAQQRRYLPAIINGDALWCQGFSEPGAGSDLAALSTRAVRNGDDYVVDGGKIWTTHAHFADFMAALVRTEPLAERRGGISFLIIDMRAPGVQIRPIKTIGGDHEVNQVFLDQVSVPASNLVGHEGQGWEIAKFLLDYERGGDVMSAAHRALLEEIRQVALRREVQNEDFWRAFATVAIDIDTLEMLELRTLLHACDPTPSPSILKLRASEIEQSITELGLDILGADAMRWNAGRPLYALADTRPEEAFTSRYLNSRATTIFGGAREIQKGLIARGLA